MYYLLEDTNKVSYISQNNKETMLLSCIQKIMGNIYVDHLEHPQSIIFQIGDFCFLFGKANVDIELEKEFMIVVCDNEEWQKVIENKYSYHKVTRYALKKEKDIFDVEKLENIVNRLDKKYVIKDIDEHIYHLCLKEKWSNDLVANYKDYSMYKQYGIGYVVLYEDEIVAGASSYSTYKEGIEIEIDTKNEYRQKGLASVIGAKLILECLDRGLYPSWDAHTKISLKLAEKLGYHLDYEYSAYEVCGKD